jgi:hypothetical protein
MAWGWLAGSDDDDDECLSWMDMLLFLGYMIVCGIAIRAWMREPCPSTGKRRTCLQCGLRESGIKMLVWTHGHERTGEHGAWTFNLLQAKMMCLLDMDVSVRDTGEDRRLLL